MSQRKKLIRVGIGSIVVKVVGTGLSFALSIVLARILGVEEYGIYSFAFSFLIFISIPIQAGIPNLAVRETAKAHLREDWTTIKGVLFWIFSLVLFYFFLLSIIYGIYELTGLHWINENRYEVITIGFFVIPLTALVVNQGAIIRGVNKIIAGIIPDTIIRQGGTLFFVFLWLSMYATYTLTAKQVMGMYVFSLTIAFLISSFIVGKTIPREFRFSKNINLEHKQWVKSASVLSMAGGIQLMYGYSDVIILGIFGSDAEVGIYRAVAQFGLLITFGLSVINPILHPQFSKLYSVGDMQKLQELVTASSLVIFVLAIIPTIIFFLLGEFLLNITFGTEYLAGIIALKILVIGQLANAAFGSVGALLNMTGHEKDAMKGMTFSFFIYVILCFLFIPLYGVEGAAIANATSLIIWNAVLRYYVKKRLAIESIGIVGLLNYKNKK